METTLSHNLSEDLINVKAGQGSNRRGCAKASRWGWRAMELTIAICTFRRPSIAGTLRSIAEQRGFAGLPTIVVIDNDNDKSAESRIRAAAAEAGVLIKYVHAPAQNISIARNAALDAATSRWLAFIDDDEEAEPDWLVRLSAHIDCAQAVIGISRAIYSPSQPKWLERCDFHSNRITGRIDNAYTCNALLDLDFVRRHGLRFDLALGRTGGEDTLFFRSLTAAGGVIAYRPDAVVTEPVPASRARMRWVLRRNFRAGQTHGLLLATHDHRAFQKLPLTAGAKAAVSATAALALLPGSARSRRWAARAALHAGALTYRLNRKILIEY